MVGKTLYLPSIAGNSTLRETAPATWIHTLRPMLKIVLRQDRPSSHIFLKSLSRANELNCEGPLRNLRTSDSSSESAEAATVPGSWHSAPSLIL